MRRRGGKRYGTPTGEPVPQAIDPASGFKVPLSSLNMLPNLAPDDFPDQAASHPVLSRHIAKWPTRSVSGPDRQNVLFGQLGAMVIDASLWPGIRGTSSTLAPHVFYVFAGRAREYVGGIAATSFVACVAGMEITERAFCEFVAKTMRVISHALKIERPVAYRLPSVAGPEPAFIRSALINARPKGAFQGAVLLALVETCIRRAAAPATWVDSHAHRLTNGRCTWQGGLHA